MVNFNDLSKEELIELLESYDIYIKIMNENNEVPSTIQDFYDNDIEFYKKGHCNNCGMDLKECGFYTINRYEATEDGKFISTKDDFKQEELYCGECGEQISNIVIDEIKILSGTNANYISSVESLKQLEEFKKEMLLAIYKYGIGHISVALDSESNIYYGEYIACLDANNAMRVTEGYHCTPDVRDEIIEFCKNNFIKHYL